ncbi:hypothetical protein GCM10014715_39230 [Streptomyces spiralis]|uniref:Uncharacterized protein n=1 Tax=Streptomyces spiralis TaxID=66376 RepID=A0A919A145_9ACTN|nr:hypothetical protein [Streptomyces spiralis]GHE80041.1 hypothetical protein GCM10014715_39230 [Streptomyces spiralis]
MSNLPALRREAPDRLVLDSAQQVTPVLIALARAWREDPVGIGALFGDIADHDDTARAQAHLDGLGEAEHARDQLADQLLAEVGGAGFHLDHTRDRHAAHQARRIAEEARRMADLLDAHAHWITIEVEEAEREQTARQLAELRYLQGVLRAAGLPVRLATTPCGHCSCWGHHANGLPCCMGCGTPGHAMTAHAG